MNRRARRRASRGPARWPPRARRPLPAAVRVGLAVVGVAVIAGGIALAASGSGARGGRVLGAIAILGVVLLVIAWQGAW